MNAKRNFAFFAISCAHSPLTRRFKGQESNVYLTPDYYCFTQGPLSRNRFPKGVREFPFLGLQTQAWAHDYTWRKSAALI